MLNIADTTIIVQFVVLVKTFVQKGGAFVANITDFGIEVKTKLLKHPLRTQEALAAEVSARTGLSVDGAYLSNIFAGRRNAPKVRQVICEILEIEMPDTKQKGVSQ